MAEFTKPDVNVVWASGGNKSAPSNSKIATGWELETPPYQYFNWMENRQDQMLAHINQHGISLWDNTTEYRANKSYVMGSNGQVYFALTTNTNINPTTDNGTNWVKTPLGTGYASDAEAIAGTDTNKVMTSATTHAAINKYGLGNLSRVSGDLNSEETTSYCIVSNSTLNNNNIWTGICHTIVADYNSRFQLLSSTSTGYTYIRRFYNSVWSEWEPILLSRDYASQSQAEAGASETKIMSPLRTAQLIDKKLSSPTLIWQGNDSSVSWADMGMSFTPGWYFLVPENVSGPTEFYHPVFVLEDAVLNSVGGCRTWYSGNVMVTHQGQYTGGSGGFFSIYTHMNTDNGGTSYSTINSTLNIAKVYRL